MTNGVSMSIEMLPDDLQSQVEQLKKLEQLDVTCITAASRQLRYIIAETMWQDCSDQSRELLLADKDISVRSAAYLSMRLAGGSAYE